MHVVIIGGGVHGLCTAEYLSTLPNIRLTLIEQFKPGHVFGSSHGQSRITRSTYSDALYVKLMQYAHREYWPELEQRLNQKIIHPQKGCFFGPESGSIQKYTAAVQAVGAQVTPLTRQAAHKHFPQFHFSESDAILLDQTSGLIMAHRLIQSLWTALQKRGVRLLTGQKVRQIDAERLEITTQSQSIQADKIVVCGGAWTASMFPELLQDKIRVVRQYVSYWKPPQDLPRFPVWVALGMQPSDNWYGLPPSQDEGIKIARHQLLGSDDPNVHIPDVPLAELEQIRTWARQKLRFDLKDPLHTETCLYSVTSNEDFMIDALPERPVFFATGFSGHGFKFGPLIGRYLSALLTEDSAHLSWFSKAQTRWCLPKTS